MGRRVLINMQDNYTEQLERLIKISSDIFSSSIVNINGFPIASITDEIVDDTKLSAMIAAIYSCGKQLINEMKNGTIEQIFIKSTEGYIIISSAGQNKALMIATDKDWISFDNKDFAKTMPSYLNNPVEL